MSFAGNVKCDFMDTKIKICGLRRIADIEIVNRYKPDFCGFILSQPFKRYVDRETLREMSALLNHKEMLRSAEQSGAVIPVGVFVDEPIDYVLDFWREGLIDIVQLHGREDDAYIEELRERMEKTENDRLNDQLKIIKAFQIKDEADIEAARSSHADLVLLDSGTGSGQTFDWTLIRDLGRPFFLAGGLNESNVREAVEKYRPYAVDVSSGAESKGFKDENKVRAVIREVRNV